jgi:hypothetical protein
MSVRKAARRELVDEAVAAYRQKRADLKNAWRARKPQLVPAGMRQSDPDWLYMQAVLAWADRKDLGPMLDVLEANNLSDAQRREAVALLRMLLMSRRKRGRQPGVNIRWGDPRYLCALLVEQRKRRREPAAVTKGLIAAAIRDVNGWALMKGKKPLDPTDTSADFQRIERLLREPKRLRL